MEPMLELRRTKHLAKCGEVRQEYILGTLLKEVHQSSRSMTLNSRIGIIIKEMDQSGKHLGVHFFLKDRREVCSHLTEGITACKPYTGVLVCDVRETSQNNTMQVRFHRFLASLSTSRYSH